MAKECNSDKACHYDKKPHWATINLKELPRTGKRGAPQAFPHLLYMMVERESNDMIVDITTFIEQTLVKYFRHSRYASFQRQLNLYGFRKNQNGAFEHKKFMRDAPQLLPLVQRSPQPSKVRTSSKKRSSPLVHQVPVTIGTPDRPVDERPRFEKMLYLKLAGSIVEPFG